MKENKSRVSKIEAHIEDSLYRCYSKVEFMQNREVMGMRKAMTFVLAGAFAAMMSVTAFAGEWKQDAAGWWFDNGNGTWPANAWQWIDGNKDGTAECYYFNQNGYALMNSATPDGYEVDGNGAWIVNGIVQTKYIGGGVTTTDAETTSKSGKTLILYDEEPILSETSKKLESAQTNKENQSWAKVLKIGSNYTAPEVGYLEYYAGGNYSSLKATVAPCKDSVWDKTASVTFQVLGDADEVLYEKKLDYRSNIFNIDVDIEGQDSVTIYLMINDEQSYLAPVILKSARFEQ